MSRSRSPLEDVKMVRKSMMSFPSPPYGSASPHGGQIPSPQGPAAASHARGPLSPSRCQQQGGHQPEGEHQLEKLEFALAVALTRGDTSRSAWLRDQIAGLGGNLEEPGT